MSEIIQLAPPSAKPAPPPFEPNASAVRTDGVYILFTTIDETLGAVRVASAFGRAMSVPLTLIHFRPVPYAWSVDGPAGVSPIETQAFVERVRAEGIEVRARVFLCRSQKRAIPLAFKPHSLIVVGGRRTWWRTTAERWRRSLEAAGHFVLFVDPTDSKEPSHA